MIMRVFEWEDGFTPYSATVDGVTLVERQGDTVERVSRLVRRREWDGHAGATDYAMADGFASGDVDGVAVAWIDGQAFELAPSGDFDCCAAGEHARELARGDRARASVPGARWDSPRHEFTGDVLATWSEVVTISCEQHFAHNVPTFVAVAL